MSVNINIQGHCVDNNQPGEDWKVLILMGLGIVILFVAIFA